MNEASLADKPAGDAVIDVRDVRYSVGGRAIFDGLDITARRGRITAFMGPSGTGKTTLLRLITGQSVAERAKAEGDGSKVDVRYTSVINEADLAAIRQFLKDLEFLRSEVKKGASG